MLIDQNESPRIYFVPDLGGCGLVGCSLDEASNEFTVDLVYYFGIPQLRFFEPTGQRVLFV